MATTYARANALMTGQAFSRGKNTPLVDLQFGGNMGWATHYAEWPSMTHYVRKNMVCLLMEAPRFFQSMPNPEFWIGALKSICEVQAKSWDGLKSSLTVNTATTAVGGAGEMFDDPTNVTRERSEPSLTIVDLYGRPVQNFLHEWITYGVMDPDTKVPSFTTVAGVKPTDWLADMYSATMLFFEADPTHTHIAKAWLVTNMFPKATGDILGKRDMTADGETLELQIGFTGITQTSSGVVDLAQTLLDAMNKTNANPMVRKAFMDAIGSDVSSNSVNAYKGGLEMVGAESARPS
jgi:hypothetical protein